MRLRRIILAASMFAALATGAFFASSALALTKAQQAEEAKPIPIHTEVPIPVSPVEQGVSHYSNGVVRDVADYIQVVYNFVISIVGLVAAVMMIIGGFQYLTSAGDAGKIGAAKKRIADALIGMVLALGSYALLNTINPALLQFKPLSEGVTAVATHLSFLPWCEDLVDKGSPPTKVTGTECGGLGKYKVGNADSYCVYRGSCVPGGGKGLYEFGWDDLKYGVATCIQQQGLTTKDIDVTLQANILTPDKTPPFALCLPCANISPNVAASLGMGIQDACDAWSNSVNEYRGKTPNQYLWSYCGQAGSYPGCVQADINCQSANDNSDRAGGSQCSDGSHSCGCEGYDDQPYTVVMDHNLTLDDERTIAGRAGNVWTHQETLDLLPNHLAEVCAWNPCHDYKDDRITPDLEGKSYKGSSGGAAAVVGDVLDFTGVVGAAVSEGFGIGKSTFTYRSQAYKAGCRSDNGGAYTFSRVILHGIGGAGGIKDCRNQ